MQIVDRGTSGLRVFERGVGETLACGTGRVRGRRRRASAGLLDAEVRVDLPRRRGPRIRGRVRASHAGSPARRQTVFTGQSTFETRHHRELDQ